MFSCIVIVYWVYVDIPAYYSFIILRKFWWQQQIDYFYSILIPMFYERYLFILNYLDFLASWELEYATDINIAFSVIGYPSINPNNSHKDKEEGCLITGMIK